MGAPYIYDISHLRVNIRNTLPKSGTFLLGHHVYIYIYIYIYIPPEVKLNEKAFSSSETLICIQTEKYGRIRHNFANPRCVGTKWVRRKGADT